MGKFKIYIKSLAVFLLFINTLHLSAQNQITYFGVDDGLPSSNIYHTFQDSKGYIWVSTDKGLARYDGYKFEVFTVKDGLPYNDVWGVQEDLQGRIWLLSYASHFTHYSYEDNKFHDIKNEDGNNLLISHFHVDEKKEIWAIPSSSNKFYNIFNPTKNKTNNIKSNSQSQGFRNIKTFPIHGYPKVTHGTYNVGFSQLKINFSDSSFLGNIYSTKYSFLSSGYNNLIWHNFMFHSDLNGILFIDYLTKKEHTFNYINIGINNSNKIINSIFYSHSKLYILTTNKIITFDTILNCKIIKEYPIPFPSINNIMQDKDGNEWVSTKNDGLVYIVKNNSLVNHERTKFKSTSSSITTIDGDKYGNIIYGLKSGEIIFKSFNHQKSNSFNFDNESKAVKCIKITSNKQLILSHYSSTTLCDIKLNKLVLCKSKLYSILQLPESLNIKKVNCINSSEILTTHYNKLMRFNILDNTNQTLLLNKRYQTSISDNNKQIWMASTSGLSKLVNDSTANELESLKKKFPIIEKSILAMQCDKKNTIWCGTDGYGIYAFKNNTPFVIKELANEIINDISIDFKDNVWVSTNKGGYKIQVMNEAKFEYKLLKYTIAQGLPTNEVNCIFANDSFAYFGTQKGLGIVYLKELKTISNTPPFYIQKIIAGNDTINAQSFTTTYNQSRIEVDYVCLSYNSKRNITYYYQLEGIDNVWQTTDQLKIVYPFLPPGNYKLLIKAKDINDQFSKTETIKFTITPPFWQTWWFRLLVALALILSILGFIAYRIAKVKRKEKEKTIVNKKLAELELQALQSQMNPHFIFNSLNAIQSYIFNQNEILANDYLTKFSRLMRLFLESSRKKYIALNDEINLITIYTEMELMRFKDKFKVEIKITDNVDRSQEIPSMLIQPFVENAINHGLLYKEESGLLNITFEEQDNILSIIIDDDGIGREAARKAKTNSIKSYKSRAMEITQDRLSTLKTIDEMTVNIEIIDKFENELAIGTKVIITIENID